MTVGPHLTAPDYAGEPKRVFVVNALDARFDRSAPESSAGAINESRRQCGVESLLYRPNSMGLDPEAKALTAIATFKPDATLSLRLGQRNLYNGDARSGAYVLTPHDVGANRDTRKAGLVLGAGSSVFSNRNHAGAGFAVAVVRQMAEDGVLKSCPPPPAKQA